MKELALPAFVEVTVYTRHFPAGYKTRLNISRIHSFHSTDQMEPKGLYQIANFKTWDSYNSFKDEHQDLYDKGLLEEDPMLHKKRVYVPIKEKTIIIAYSSEGQRRYYFSDLSVDDFERLCSTPPVLREYLKELKDTEDRLDKKIARFKLMDLD